MPAAHRLGDWGTGHGCWVPRPNDQASEDVFVDDIGWHRMGDTWPSHCCPVLGCHPSNMKKGSPTVFVNKKEAARVDDPVVCGSTAMTGSPSVFAG